MDWRNKGMVKRIQTAWRDGLHYVFCSTSGLRRIHIDVSFHCAHSRKLIELVAWLQIYRNPRHIIQNLSPTARNVSRIVGMTVQHHTRRDQEYSSLKSSLLPLRSFIWLIFYELNLQESVYVSQSQLIDSPLLVHMKRNKVENNWFWFPSRNQERKSWGLPVCSLWYEKEADVYGFLLLRHFYNWGCIAHTVLERWLCMCQARVSSPASPHFFFTN